MLPILVVYLQFLSVVLTTDPIPVTENEFNYCLLVLPNDHYILYVSNTALHKTCSGNCLQCLLASKFFY
jgi:hypothetical protein